MASPDWTLEWVQRLAAHLQDAQVPAYAEALGKDVYLCVPVVNATGESEDLVTMWRTGRTGRSTGAAPTG